MAKDEKKKRKAAEEMAKQYQLRVKTMEEKTKSYDKNGYEEKIARLVADKESSEQKALEDRRAAKKNMKVAKEEVNKLVHMIRDGDVAHQEELGELRAHFEAKLQDAEAQLEASSRALSKVR